MMEPATVRPSAPALREPLTPASFGGADPSDRPSPQGRGARGSFVAAPDSAVGTNTPLPSGEGSPERSEGGAARRVGEGPSASGALTSFALRFARPSVGSSLRAAASPTA